MKNFGVTSIAVLALLGQIDGTTAIEMNQAGKGGVADAATNKLNTVSTPVEAPKE